MPRRKSTSETLTINVRYELLILILDIPSSLLFTIGNLFQK